MYSEHSLKPINIGIQWNIRIIPQELQLLTRISCLKLNLILIAQTPLRIQLVAINHFLGNCQPDRRVFSAFAGFRNGRKLNCEYPTGLVSDRCRENRKEGGQPTWPICAFRSVEMGSDSVYHIIFQINAYVIGIIMHYN